MCAGFRSQQRSFYARSTAGGYSPFLGSVGCVYETTRRLLLHKSYAPRSSTALHTMCQPPRTKARTRGRGRKRQGAVPKQLNPLKLQFCDFARSWGAWHERLDLSKPLVVDVGCGEGEWCVEAANSRPDLNFLGIDVRATVFAVRASNAPANCAFLAANTAAGDLAALLAAWRDVGGRTLHVLCQFPDPHWKNKNRNRRMLTRAFFATAAAHVSGRVVVRSDVAGVVQDAAALVGDALVAADAPADLIVIPTERQGYALQKGGAVHTAAFRPSVEACAHGRVCAALRRPRSVLPGPAALSGGGPVS